MEIAKTTVPHYTYVEEVDMSEIVALRNQAKPKAAGRGIKLTFLPFIIRALVATLKDHPYLNASLDGEAGEIVLKRYYNIGVAAATDRGLMVPVVHGADARDLFDLAAEIERLSEAARAGSIGLDDLHGGTFTITSTGNIGGFLATPVINVPEVAILGLTAIRERPVVRDGEIVIRHMANLSLSCDHRVVDGAVAALFMRDLVALLEDPKLQLLAGL
jgi:pyruvate dehydrogenase E2 component (dihydrolipoamide acetyltransferase)